nr:MAG TPA_asm: Protein of unknown function (DUF3164) [Caudoviricetes sp.]
MNENLELVKNLTKEQRAELLAQLQNEVKNDRMAKRESYEGLRSQFMHDVFSKVEKVESEVGGFKKWLDGETSAFTKMMREYGAVKNDGQQSYTITDGDLKLEVKFNKVKGFDERADLAAERLVDYLKRYMQASEKGVEDPMYQMAMTLLERNKTGDLDYKSISKLYELEDKFDSEYAEIMHLFKEANVVQNTATNYYFSKRNPETGVWHKIEPSFCRL